MRMIFVNLPVKDIARSRAFYGALGLTFNEAFSDENTACVVVEENIFVLLHQEESFRQYIVGEIADPGRGVEVLNCLSAGGREEVDDLLARALAAGGAEWKPVMDLGFMYGASFRDPDGHVWELSHMAAATPPKD